MSDIAIKVENLSKCYHIGVKDRGLLSERISHGIKSLFSKNGKSQDPTEFWALRDVNFEIKKGDAVGIIGKNGAGKSTLLKILSRITEPTSGKITINGRVASLLEVGTGFHQELTGRENIFMNGAILGMKQSEIKRKFDEIVAFSGIEKFIDTPVKHYSSGMYVRLAFAVAAHLDPEILIIDEVLAVGDAEFQKKCLGKMEDVAKNQGRTVLFVSHQLGMVRTLCNKGVMLKSGELAFEGSANDVIDKYLHSSSSGDNASSVSFPIVSEKNAQILSAKLVNREGTESTNFDVFDEIFLELEYIVRRDLTGSGIYIDVERNGSVLFRSFDTDLQPELLQKRQAGFYKTQVKLHYPLKAGVYEFRAIGIGILNIGDVHRVENVLRFDVEERSFDHSLVSFASKRQGEIVTQLSWNALKVGSNLEVQNLV
ncbi:MAG: ABC transporter ATP-binding protein [Chloroherpetonaceae bacterium]